MDVSGLVKYDVIELCICGFFFVLVGETDALTSLFAFLVCLGVFFFRDRPRFLFPRTTQK